MTIVLRHWWHDLPAAACRTGLTDHWEKLAQREQELHEQLCMVRDEMDRIDKRIKALVQRDWTPDEIQTALDGWQDMPEWYTRTKR